MITLGSLFDGIGGWLIAAKRAGVKPVWSSEIEKVPLKVTAEHFPDVEQVGDITNITGYNLEPVDIITLGSPCQGLSLAGQRKGLQDNRSGLFLEAIRIIHEMREKTHGKYPKYVVWENVCFHKDTLITTKDGLKRICDVSIGDEVLTSKGVFKKVVNTIRNKSKSTLLLSICGTETLVVTPNHPFLCRTNLHTRVRSFSPPTWKCAGDLTKDDFVGYPVDPIGEKSIGMEFAYAVGRWLADGSYIERERGARGGQKHRIFISTGYKKYEKTKKELQKLPYPIRENLMQHAVNFTFTSDEFFDLIKGCNKGARNKVIPQWVYELVPEEQEEFLRGYLEGDGFLRRDNQYSFSTSSRKLAYGLARLVRDVYHVGCSVTLVRGKGRTTIEGRVVNAHDFWTGYFCKPCGKRKGSGSFYDNGLVWCRVKNINQGEVCDVYNLSVDEINTYCANGIAVHNCGAFSSNKGMDFRTVIESFTKTSIPVPELKWAKAGMVECESGTLGWRTLDAQYWGVPQHRERIFLVNHFGTGGVLTKYYLSPRACQGILTRAKKANKVLPMELVEILRRQALS